MRRPAMVVEMGAPATVAWMELADRVTVVTGGGSGIGRCTVHELSSLGAHLAIIGRSQEKLDRVVAEVEEDGGSIDAYASDIRDEAAVISTVDKILDSRGQIHGLVNNAGGQFPALAEYINHFFDESLLWVLGINF